MGTMADIGMPVGLTFAGRAYDDVALLTYAAAFEATGRRRTAPPRTPPLPR
jgi:amidase